MTESIRVDWGGHEWRARQTSYKVTGKIKATKDTHRVIVEPLGLTVDGTSSTVNEGVDVRVSLNMSKDMVYDLFERMLSFERNDKAELVRIGKTHLEGLRRQT